MRGLLSTLWKLGLMNCATVLAYRMKCRTGIYRRATPIASLPQVGAALASARPRPLHLPATEPALIAAAEQLLHGKMEFFERHSHEVGSPPDWFRDPWSGQSWSTARTHWSDVHEFAVAGNDIKAIWEPSRFRWAVLLARAYSTTQREEFLRTLSVWLDDWSARNPVNGGVNWKCGQEASIRLLRFLEAVESIEWQPEAASALAAFVLAHLRRIAATLPYALAQQNNHGTTEAAALFVGAHLLLSHTVAAGSDAAEAARFARRGRLQLLERIDRLILSDGTFSQYSVNYHRMVLDTVSLAEAWRRRLGAPEFLDPCKQRVQAAVDWLWSLVQPNSGEAPNLGANDGTTLLIAPGSPYNDHRASLQLASAVLLGKRLFPPGPWDDALRAWAVSPDELPLETRKRSSRAFIEGGLVMLHAGDDRTWGVIRLPRFKFRPSHADALHLDVWSDGQNVVRDTGTYSYNAAGKWYEYFAGTRGHSTCEFDGHDQMPRLGRFLFSRWLTPSQFRLQHQEGAIRTVVAGYRDHWGARHRRSVELGDRTWIVIDEVSGFRNRAVVRWQLAPGAWQLSGNRLIGPHLAIDVDESVPAHRISLVEGWESRAYMERTAIPVLEIELTAAGAVRTVISALQ